MRPSARGGVAVENLLGGSLLRVGQGFHLPRGFFETPPVHEEVPSERVIEALCLDTCATLKREGFEQIEARIDCDR